MHSSGLKNQRLGAGNLVEESHLKIRMKGFYRGVERSQATFIQWGQHKRSQQGVVCVGVGPFQDGMRLGRSSCVPGQVSRVMRPNRVPIATQGASSVKRVEGFVVVLCGS